MSGQVTDQQGAAIPAAEVKLVDSSTNSISSTTTNDSGRYNFFNVAPASYDLIVMREGFSETKLRGQKVSVGLVHGAGQYTAPD